MPLDDDNDDDPCWMFADQVAEPTSVKAAPSAAILAPYEVVPIPQPSTSQSPHATLPGVSHHSQTPAILGSTFGIMIALVAFYLASRYVSRRQSLAEEPFKPGFSSFRFWPRTTIPKRRLSDESWVSPVLPTIESPGSPLSHDYELSRCASPRRKLVPVTTPVCTPTDTEFGSRTELANGDLTSSGGHVVSVLPVRVPLPVYFPPFSPAPSLTSSSSSLSRVSPTPSTEPLTSLTSNKAHLLSPTFMDIRVVESPARPTTAHIIRMARPYAHAYRPSSTTNASLYTQPTLSARPSGASFCPSPTARDTFSTVTTSDVDMCAVPHLLHAVTDDRPTSDASSREQQLVGTSLGLKLRLSDASEHARYRLRERERERERECTKERLSAASYTSTASSVDMVRKEFRLRDSESVLREIGW